MAARKSIKEASVRESLLLQLAQMGADKEHFIDLVEDYIKFLGVQRRLQADIKKRGVMFKDFSSTGVEMMKNNPSVKELVMVNRQMLALLKELGITTDKVTSDGEDDDL